MNDIIRLNNVAINNETRETVSARELHSFLGVGKDFSNWIKSRIKKYGFTENVDFVCSPVLASANLQAQERIEYFTTLDMAKELAMVERNEKGRQARQYFIECEKKLKQSSTHAIPQSLPEALRLAASIAEEKEKLRIENEVLKPKADFCDKVSRAINAITVRDFAKVVGTGQNRLFDFLRSVGLLMIGNKPYQEFVDRGYFRLVEKERKDQNGEVQTYTQTLITGKGQIYIQQKYFPQQIH